MDITNRHMDIINHAHQNNISHVQENRPRAMSMREKVFHTNWGIALIGALVAVGILAASIHTNIEASAVATPQAAAETVAVLPVE